MDIFEYEYNKQLQNNAPLAARVRPKSLSNFVGQQKIISKSSTLYKAIINDTLFSSILYGPPGSGKTTLAKIIAATTSSIFVELNATSSGVKEIKEIIKNSKDALAIRGTKTIIFIDEIHRFNKSQQDTLLPFVEDGTITLIGATTENPLFEVNKALLSRCLVFTLEALSEDEIEQILKQAIEIEEINIHKAAISYLTKTCNGDARYALNTLEMVINTNKMESIITTDHIKNVIPNNRISYDKAGEEHYNTISAFIKSIRGSDPNAAIYYLARMLSAGEDPKFIARRLIILASEDIGNADPQALLIATAAFNAVQFVGMPECRISLSQATIYLATAPKSNTSYIAINSAIKDVTILASIPNHLKNHNIVENEDSYLYPHDYPNGYVFQQYMPTNLYKNKYYNPKDIGYEKEIKKYMESLNTGRNCTNE